MQFLLELLQLCLGGELLLLLFQLTDFCSLGDKLGSLSRIDDRLRPDLLLLLLQFIEQRRQLVVAGS